MRVKLFLLIFTFTILSIKFTNESFAITYQCQIAIPAYVPGNKCPPIYDTWVHVGTVCDPTRCSPPAMVTPPPSSCPVPAPVSPTPPAGIQSISKSPQFYTLCCCLPFTPPNPQTVPPTLNSTQPKAVWTALGLLATEPEYFIADILSLVLGIAGGIAFLLLLAGAFGYITSSGSPDAVMGAKSTITAALTGLAVIIFSV
ncbi:hypothetical protein L6255_03205, partial [Candidatus Parcubacteria bacterium]|nr:hypothetical protein [Patescibacteria group bacterium]MCG2689420.1 hypothetical protein [Candidatus Parcubacteria bacterium]